jgi:hypothetical protein
MMDKSTGTLQINNGQPSPPMTPGLLGVNNNNSNPMGIMFNQDGSNTGTPLGNARSLSPSSLSSSASKSQPSSAYTSTAATSYTTSQPPPPPPRTSSSSPNPQHAATSTSFRSRASRNRQREQTFPRLSKPVELLRTSYDVVVIGSGYGGGVAASRMARTGQSVCVLERGRERWPGEYPHKSRDALKEVHCSGVLGEDGGGGRSGGHVSFGVGEGAECGGREW